MTNHVTALRRIALSVGVLVFGAVLGLLATGIRNSLSDEPTEPHVSYVPIDSADEFVDFADVVVVASLESVEDRTFFDPYTEDEEGYIEGELGDVYSSLWFRIDDVIKTTDDALIDKGSVQVLVVAGLAESAEADIDRIADDNLRVVQLGNGEFVKPKSVSNKQFLLLLSESDILGESDQAFTPIGRGIAEILPNGRLKFPVEGAPVRGVDVNTLTLDDIRSANTE